MRRRWFAPLLLLLPLTAGAQRPRPAAPAAASALDSSAWAALRYRHIGPEGNRVSAVAGVDGDPMTYYAGAASGGIWKSTDAGVHWTPIFDKEQGQSIGAITVAPSDPNVVWVGTGESWIRSHISVGFGVYRSTDAGKSWKRVGLETSGRISRIVVHPTNPDVAFVAVQGHGYQPQAERGIWRTRDAGATWEKVLFV
ncbi:MAG: glycosyl hydrolase, partial [Gemmatimonadaceae bacterium]|nr:glycosyl hydrolase [Gemmatimonadaceae bacterium]